MSFTGARSRRVTLPPAGGGARARCKSLWCSSKHAVEEPRVPFPRSRERSPAVTEEHALDHVAWQRSAVHRYEGSPPTAHGMNAPREQVLPCSSCSDEQNWERSQGEAISQRDSLPKVG